MHSSDVVPHSDSALEDEAQILHFDFSANLFNCNLYNLVESDIDKMVVQLKKTALEATDDPSEIEKFEDEIKQLRNELVDKATSTLKDFEPRTKQLFNIPKNVVESTSAHKYRSNGNSEDIESITKEIDVLENLYLEERLRGKQYKERLEKLTALKPVHDNIQMSIHKVESVKKGIKGEERLLKITNKHAQVLQNTLDLVKELDSDILIIK